jgi:hypothetical protein
VPRPARRARPGPRRLRYARHGFCRRPSSSGWRQTARTWRVHLGRSSNHRRPWCASDTSPGMGRGPAPITPTAELVWWGARKGRVVTTAGRPCVRPATRGMRVVSSASARLIAGRMVARRRASIDFPAPGGPSNRTLWTQCPHRVQLHPRY